MGSVYQRPGSKFWWFNYIDATGKRRQQSSGEVEEAKAQALLKAIERKIEREKAATGGKGALTFKRFAEETWLPAREIRDVRSLSKDKLWLSKAYPHIGDMPIAEVVRADIQAVVDAARAARLAPRTVNHIYKTMRKVFASAVRLELRDGTPCDLDVRLGDLPKNVDADPMWRRTAIFTRAEAEQLIGDSTIPEARRVLHGLQVLGGLRVGEAIVRRWRDYDTEARPLGMLAVDTHWDAEKRVIRPGTKTSASRDVPVHPTLAAMLATWRLSGWAKRHGRAPGPEDFICGAPGPESKVMNPTACWQAQNRTLARLGMRPRRQHDFRATFISLAQADGGLPHVLQWVTHGKPDTIIGDYTRLPWASLCAEVAKLRLKRRGAQAARLRALAT